MRTFMFVAKASEVAYSFQDAADRAAFMTRFSEWTQNLQRKQQFLQADELCPEYKRVGLQQGHAALKDGPFAETKEVLTGYFLVRAEGMDEAVEIAKQCPVLRFDDLEVYQIKGEN